MVTIPVQTGITGSGLWLTDFFILPGSKKMDDIILLHGKK